MDPQHWFRLENRHFVLLSVVADISVSNSVKLFLNQTKLYSLGNFFFSALRNSTQKFLALLPTALEIFKRRRHQCLIILNSVADSD
jgi:hypothetical protein